MQTATDIAEKLAPAVYPLLEARSEVAEALRQGGGGHRRGHVIDAASFDENGADISFDGEFDFHLGREGDQPGRPALRVNVAGHLRPLGDVAGDAEVEWSIADLSVESLQVVDAAHAPDEL